MRYPSGFALDYLRVTLGLTSNRAVQKQIEHERKQGKVILSSTQPPGGYFLPETKQEIRRFKGRWRTEEVKH